MVEPRNDVKHIYIETYPRILIMLIGAANVQALVARRQTAIMENSFPVRFNFDLGKFQVAGDEILTEGVH